MFGGADDNQAPADNNDNQPMDNGGQQDDMGGMPVAGPTPNPDTQDSQDNSGNSEGSDNNASADSPAPQADDVMPSNHAAHGDLLNLKQQALQQLSPLVSHLDQSPEEKFRTTMMMIQASDNAELLKEAYDAANAIPDEKVKAQALLDIINEINYFTQQGEDPN